MTIQNRYDFVLLFDVKDGNPNGDPDNGNFPRIDTETSKGLVTDVCLKRKIRNYVGLIKGEQPPYEIYVKEKSILNKTHDRAYLAISAGEELKGDKKRKGDEESAKKARQWMCQNFYDVRTFGAVMSTGTNCGQVRGPVQITFARSIDSIVPAEHSITRMAVTTAAEAEQQDGDNRTMGRKFTVPYGLYRTHGFISASLAEQTGFNENDLSLLWEAITNMFEQDRSAARGEMAVRGLYVFKHDSKLGNAHAHKLFDLIEVKKIKEEEAARDFKDYEVTIKNELPQGITLQKLVK